MKTIDELRKEFEEKIQMNMYGIHFNGEFYQTNLDDESHNCEWVNGAWWMFQELRNENQD